MNSTQVKICFFGSLGLFALTILGIIDGQTNGVALCFVGGIVFLLIVIIDDILKFITERSRKKKDKKRSNTMLNSSSSQFNSLPVIRNSPHSWENSYPSYTSFSTPTFYERTKTEEDVKIAKILADVKKHESDNETIRAISHNLSHSPLAVESKRRNPNVQPSMESQTTEELILWGFLRVARRVTHRVFYRD